ncbi:MAG: metallophosphoesterase, partial [Deltaproteobacteria bacterium]|nr:metallophosphoesterase [Deltaproteobacteria bacterium]
MSLLPALDARAEAFRKGPYLQWVTTSSVTIVWESDAELPGRVVVQSPVEPDRVVEAPLARLQEVRVTDLSAGRRYSYAVEAGGERATGELITAPSGDEPFSFVVFGDSRSNADSHRVVVERVRREVPDFILGTGDMVNEGASEKDWQVFFQVERQLLRENVLFPSLGNHDRQGRHRGADNYRKYFAVPDDSPDPERYYAFTYGNSRFLVLDSNSYSFALTDQTAWIERELRLARENPAIQHVFVNMHHPPYSISLHGGQPELREMWTPIFERFGVDAVFSGHDHCYARSQMNNVRYFVSGGGGAPLYPRDPNPAPLDLSAAVYF